jgi:hypothetical protein
MSNMNSHQKLVLNSGIRELPTKVQEFMRIISTINYFPSIFENTINVPNSSQI